MDQPLNRIIMRPYQNSPLAFSLVLALIQTIVYNSLPTLVFFQCLIPMGLSYMMRNVPPMERVGLSLFALLSAVCIIAFGTSLFTLAWFTVESLLRGETPALFQMIDHLFEAPSGIPETAA